MDVYPVADSANTVPAAGAGSASGVKHGCWFQPSPRGRSNAMVSIAPSRTDLSLSLIHISEPTRLALI
eukprot:3799924-Alexandrium_andersonii.AAC.1